MFSSGDSTVCQATLREPFPKSKSDIPPFGLLFNANISRHRPVLHSTFPATPGQYARTLIGKMINHVLSLLRRLSNSCSVPIDSPGIKPHRWDICCHEPLEDLRDDQLYSRQRHGYSTTPYSCTACLHMCMAPRICHAGPSST